MNDTTTKVGLVGLGNIGEFHADNLEILSEECDVRLGGGMDVDPTARGRFETNYGVPTFKDVETLFDAVDAVIVTTPNRFHEQYAVAALDADCHVLVEKPLAHTVESAERIAAATERADPVCMVGFHNRFANPVQVLAAYVEAGRFGDVTHVEVDYVRRRGIPGLGTWFTDRATAGGGAVLDIGAHGIDLALYLLGFPDLREVTGVTRSEFGIRDDYAYLDMWGQDDGDDFDVEDSASAFVRCRHDVTISLEVAWATNRPQTTDVVICGTEASASLDLDIGDLEIHEVGTAGTTHFTDTSVRTTDEDPHLEELRRFVAAIRSDERLTTNTPEQALAVQRLVDGIYRSSVAGRAVRFGEDENDPRDGSEDEELPARD
jgi:predicted dehydrogenase